MSNNKITFTLLDLQKIQCKDNGELLVVLQQVSPGILCQYRRQDTGIQKIWVRQSVSDKLQRVQSQLALYQKNIRLLVVEGYRSIKTQERLFVQQLLIEHKKCPNLDLDELIEHVFKFIALPSVAGHSTGGAVDLTLSIDGREVDMGGNIAEFKCSELIPTYSSLTTPEQAKWRHLLHDLMKAEGFAPYYGEWWHFSYGDREWAAFYKKPEAIYTPLWFLE